MSDYKNTLNLPKTKFSMRANLTKNEPKMLEFWEQNKAYQKMISSGPDNQRFVLHDGPPYANGNIHLGTAMNKILKDIIIKSKNLSGYKAEYVPGWDCHGLPIELKVEQSMGDQKKEMTVLDIRKSCRKYALKYLDIQRNEFKRLGGFGVWDNPYLTMAPEYEAATAGELAKFMSRGSVKRSKKPIYWCCSCETALAEAEVEYFDHKSPSIYVGFPLRDEKIIQKLPAADPSRLFILIWTTTPWTIPDNMAVALHPDVEYVLVEQGGKQYILASELLDECTGKFGWEQPQVLNRIIGRELEGIHAGHPIYSRDSVLVLADYVTLETGTGCVHTAPGHGREDYETGLRYGLEVYSPLDDQGKFLPSVEFFAGMNVFESNPAVISKLKEKGNLLAEENIAHSYPHCWRCKKPVIFRATTQWFISMRENDLRGKALQAIDNEVRWIPSWGRERIHNMIEHRPDWCISRQRNWGVPIIALICNDCGQAWHDPEWVNGIVQKFESHSTGADYWFETPVEDMLPRNLACPQCGAQNWKKEDNILDVWFDSGTSYAAVVEKRKECGFPADLYLEGTDQHRGWFHSSLLASVGTRDVPPYKAVLTHGFVVDGKGRKMSKSIGNVVAPHEIINKYGAEILRMWVSSENYQEDLRISDEILKRLVDAYRRIRNTCRFILGNLYDFDPAKDIVDPGQMLPLDRYALDIILQRNRKMNRAYEDYEFHKVFHVLHNLCVTDLSAFYLDIIKDRLYVNPAESLERRSAQTVLYYTAMVLLKNMAPVLSFTAEEVYQNLPEQLRTNETVFGMRYAFPEQDIISAEEKARWEMIVQLRNEITRAIEPERKNGVLGHSLDSRITVFAPEELLREIKIEEHYLRETFIVSQILLDDAKNAPQTSYQGQEMEEIRILVETAKGEKCARCWTFSENLGSNPEHPQACPRCTQILHQLES